MPYKRAYKKRQYRRNRTTNKKVVKNIVKQELKKNIELKYIFQSITNSVGSALDTNSMTRGTDLIPEGTGRNERIGNKIQLHTLRLRGKHVLAAADSLSRIRMMIVRTLKPNYTPTLSDLLQDDTATYSILSHPNYVTMKGNFQILYDKRWQLDDAFRDSVDFNIKIKLNKPCYYDDAGNTVKGGIIICFWGDDGTYDFTSSYCSYLSYTDA